MTVSRQSTVIGIAGALAAAFGLFAIVTAWGCSPFGFWVDLVSQPVGLFFVAVGVVVGVNQPNGARMGWLLLAMGTAYYLSDLQCSTDRRLFVAGFVLFQVNSVVLTHLLLASPDGRLRPRSATVVVVALYVTTPLFQALRALAEDPLQPQLWGDPDADYSVWALAGSIVGALLTAAALLLVLRRWIKESRAARRARRLFWLSVSLVGVAAGAAAAGALLHVPIGGQGAILVGYDLAIALVGAAALVGGPISTLLAHRRMTRMLAGLDAGTRLGDRLAHALGDPGLVLLYPRADGDGWEDEAGRRAEPPAGSVETPVGPQDAPMALLAHDRFLQEYPQSERLAAAATIARLIIGVQIADRARLREIQALHAANERSQRKVERDTRHATMLALHDGPANELWVLVGRLKDLESGCTVAADRQQLHALHSGFLAAIENLRSAIRGIHPPKLIDEGVEPAVRSAFAGTTPKLTFDAPPRRWPPDLEFDMYNILREAIANAQKHAQATSIDVTIRQDGDRIVIVVADDGQGGVRTDRFGSGMSTMRRRAEGHGGRLDVSSGAGGTTITVSLSCA
ncbi:sensor histidine kinase [Dactylosporangium darangshiense]|uniref:Histidine kinase domain-containing protein n=1 Tax=Dactylosporangium darangshiense TaxID=579108 RepID=A0ABP8DM72_9ACTN